MISSLTISVVAALSFACHPKERKIDLDAKVAPDLAKKTEEQTLNMTCNNQDFSKKLSEEIKNAGVVIEEEVANKNMEHLDCDGRVFWKGHGPEKFVRKVITIESSVKDPKAKINFISIENARTCIQQNISPADDKFFEPTESPKTSDANSSAKEPFKTMVNSHGKLKLMITDSPYVTDANALNLRDGDNLVIIRYYGKCTKYKETINETWTDARNCETAEEIEHQEVYINLKVNRTDTDGTLQKKFCAKPDTQAKSETEK